MRSIEKDTENWVNAGIISPESALSIVTYEKNKKLPDSNTPMVLFAILGSILVALGISLMVAENWDNIPKFWKIIIAFCPMVVGQILIIIWKIKYPDSIAWREAPAAFLLLTTGATLALISQVFQLQGTTIEFLLFWMILVTPIMFITKSKTAYLLYTLMATWYAYLSYWQKGAEDWHYLWFFVAMVVFFIWHIARDKENHILGLHSGWLIPLSITIFLGNLFVEIHDPSNSAAGWSVIGYGLLFQIFLLIHGKKWPIENTSWKAGFGLIGLFGMLVLLYMFSFKFLVKEVPEMFDLRDLFNSTYSLITIVTLVFMYVILLISPMQNIKEPKFYLFPIFALIILLCNLNVNMGQAMMNLFILVIAIYFITNGFTLKNLYLLNLGLLIFSLLVIFRFFDFNLSFFVRGLSFLALGAGFFIANRLMLKSRKEVDA